MLATDDEAVIDAYRGFGWSLGIAFQLNDDLLGIWGDEQTTGKEPSDLAKHKKTLPLIYALETRAEPDRARLREMLAKDDATHGRHRGGARDHRAVAARANTRANEPAPSVTRPCGASKAAGVVGVERSSGSG